MIAERKKLQSIEGYVNSKSYKQHTQEFQITNENKIKLNKSKEQ